MIFTRAGWTGASIVFNHASGSATYTVSGDVLNSYDVAVDLLAWIDHASRPWSGPLTGVTLAVESDGLRRRYRYTYSGTSFTSIVPNATWIALFGDTSLATPSVASATSAVVPGGGPWDKWDDGDGERSRKGGWRPGHASLAHRRPTLELFMTQAQAYAFTQALRLASHPRSAYVYDELSGAWRFCAFGSYDLSHPDGDYTRVVGTVELLGVV